MIKVLATSVASAEVCGVGCALVVDLICQGRRKQLWTHSGTATIHTHTQHFGHTCIAMLKVSRPALSSSRRYKIMVLGATAVGKSAAILRLGHANFIHWLLSLFTQTDMFKAYLYHRICTGDLFLSTSLMRFGYPIISDSRRGAIDFNSTTAGFRRHASMLLITSFDCLFLLFCYYPSLPLPPLPTLDVFRIALSRVGLLPRWAPKCFSKKKHSKS